MALFDVFKDALPNIAKALTGPAGDLVITAITNKLGVSSENLETHIQNNPQAISSLSDVEEQVKSILDVKDARQRELEALKSNNPIAIMTTPIIAILTVVMTFAMGIIMTFYKIPVEQNQIAIFVLGFMTSAATQIFSYYFGSSQTQDMQRINSIKNLK